VTDPLTRTDEQLRMGDEGGDAVSSDTAMTPKAFPGSEKLAPESRRQADLPKNELTLTRCDSLCTVKTQLESVGHVRWQRHSDKQFFWYHETARAGT
jgi:hypothetical protein